MKGPEEDGMKMAKSGSRSPKRGNRGGGGEGKERLGGGERIEKFSRSTVACNGCRMRKQKVRGFRFNSSTRFFGHPLSGFHRGVRLLTLRFIVWRREVSSCKISGLGKEEYSFDGRSRLLI